MDGGQFKHSKAEDSPVRLLNDPDGQPMGTAEAWGQYPPSEQGVGNDIEGVGHILPAVQVRQADCPKLGLKVPGEQGVGATEPFTQKWPVGQIAPVILSFGTGTLAPERQK
jgi:hypothetical protein